MQKKKQESIISKTVAMLRGLKNSLSPELLFLLRWNHERILFWLYGVNWFSTKCQCIL